MLYILAHFTPKVFKRNPAVLKISPVTPSNVTNVILKTENKH